jgi:hypothetical protein
MLGIPKKKHRSKHYLISHLFFFINEAFIPFLQQFFPSFCTSPHHDHRTVAQSLMEMYS